MSELSDKAIDQLQLAVVPQVIEQDGASFTTRQLFPLPQAYVQREPEADTLKLNSLTALVDYVQGPFIGDREGDENGWFIQVVGPAKVQLKSEVYGDAVQRDKFAMAEYEEVTNFTFGSFMSAEEFVIKVQAQFVDTEDRKKLLALVGNIKDSKVVSTQDDGVTQQVTAKVGIVRAEDVPVPNPVWLAPRRTFPEVDQPLSPFVVRLKSADPLPQCALFEADGGAWKNEARKSIKAFLKAALPEATILA